MLLNLIFFKGVPGKRKNPLNEIIDGL